LSRRRRSVLDQLEGGIYQRVGKEWSEWFRWGVEFAQTDVSRLTVKDERTRCLELALFACAPTGIGPRPTEAGVEMPSGEELREAKTELFELLGKVRLQRPILVPSPERTLRWVDTVKTETGEVNAEEVTERQGKVSKRYVMFVRDGWVNRAKAHFCELITKFGHELRKCEAPGVCKTRWFLPKGSARLGASSAPPQAKRARRKRKTLSPTVRGPARRRAALNASLRLRSTRTRVERPEGTDRISVGRELGLPASNHVERARPPWFSP
jgi:hypothetical protein